MKKDQIIVIGCGRLGSYIASELSVAGKDVTIIDQDDDSFRKLSETYAGYKAIGDAIDVDVLEEAGIKQAKMVIVTTNNDNTNIFIGQIASMIYYVDDVVIRLGDTEKGSLLEQTNIKTIFPFELSMKRFRELFDMNEGGTS